MADIEITADLRARTVAARLTVDAPREGRALTRVNWLTRQLRGAPTDVRIDTGFEGSRQTTSELLGVLSEEGRRALLDDAKLAPRRFTVALTRDMGIKRGKGQGTFIESVTDLLETFYGEVAQEITPWTPKAPRLPENPHDDEPVRSDDAEIAAENPDETPSLPAPAAATAPWMTLRD